MFEDFETEGPSSEDRKRMGTSALASALVFGGLAAAAITAAAVTTQIVRQAEPEAEVVFENLPQEEPPPPPRRETPPPPRNNRPAPAVARQQMSAPTEIPDQVPDESGDALADAGDVGALDGELGGTGDGDSTGTGPGLDAAPPPEDEAARLAAMPQLVHADIDLPRHLGGCERPEYPQEARTRGISDRVVVRVRVDQDGVIAGIEFLRGDEVFRDAVRRCVEASRWAPAHLADGTAITYARTLSYPFRLSNI